MHKCIETMLSSIFNNDVFKVWLFICLRGNTWHGCKFGKLQVDFQFSIIWVWRTSVKFCGNIFLNVAKNPGHLIDNLTSHDHIQMAFEFFNMRPCDRSIRASAGNWMAYWMSSLSECRLCKQLICLRLNLNVIQLPNSTSYRS